VLLASVIDDPRTLDRIEGTPMETKLLNSIGPMVTLIDRGQDVKVLQQAIAAEAERLQMNPVPSVADFQSQSGFDFESGVSPETQAVHSWLASFNSKEARAKFGELTNEFAPNEDPAQVGLFGEGNQDIGAGLLARERGEVAKKIDDLQLSSRAADDVDQRELQDFEDKQKGADGVRSVHAFYNFGGDIKLNMIAVNASEQGQGIGTRIMQDLVALADKQGRRIVLTRGQRDPNFGTTSGARLKRFYKQFGFIENKGRKKDFSISENMYREPESGALSSRSASTLSQRFDASMESILFSRAASNDAQLDLFGDYAKSTSSEARVSKPAFQAQVEQDLPFLAQDEVAVGELFEMATGKKVESGKVESGKAESGKVEDTTPKLPPTTQTKAQAKAEVKAADKIEDFGEKIGGARKDYAVTLSDAKKLDIAVEPLSKVWPEPNYAKLVEAGADAQMVGLVRSMRDEVPARPRQSWKVSTYVNQVSQLRSFAEGLMNGEVDFDFVRGQMVSSRMAPKIMGRADLYAELGHAKSFKGLSVEMSHFSFRLNQATNEREYDVTKWIIRKRAGGKFAGWPREMAVGNTREEMVAQFKARLQAEGDKPAAKKLTKFEIYSYRRGEKSKGVWIGKKIGRNQADLFHFDTAKQAREFLKDNHGDVADRFEAYKEIGRERRADNAPRVGDDYRLGEDISPEQFQEAFGFRGVEFGNYVEQARRQADLNRAYDALLDLAGVLNIPSRAISLEGKLGLAFGARGQGGKNAPAAHYEPGKIVINLTKRNGPGSLAHEWWHALDNYFAGQGSSESYMTQASRMTDVGAVRAEMVDAFGAITKAIRETGLKPRSLELDKRRSGDTYWSTMVEMSARSFENYVIERMQAFEASNDYLVNIASVEEYGESMINGFMDGLTADDMYPYLTQAEIAPVKETFERFFSAVKLVPNEADANVALRSRAASEQDVLTREAFERRSEGKYEAYPLQPVLTAIEAEYARTREGGAQGEDGNGRGGFGSAEAIARKGARGISAARASQQPKTLADFSELKAREFSFEHKAIRDFAKAQGLLEDGAEFKRKWREGGSIAGAEHLVYIDAPAARVHKLNQANVPSKSVRNTLMRYALHNALFPSTAYRMEGVVVSGGQAMIRVSQPQIVEAEGAPEVSKAETDALMAEMGFEPMAFLFKADAKSYYHPGLGIVVFDLHKNNVMRLPSGSLAIIDAHIELARDHSWAALRMRDTGKTWPQDPVVKPSPALRSAPSEKTRVDDRDLAAYLNRYEIVGEKRREAIQDMRGTLALASRAAAQSGDAAQGDRFFAAYPTQGEFDLEGGVSATSPRGADSGQRSGAGALQREVSEQAATRRAFAENTPEAWAAALEAGGGRISSIIPRLVTDPNLRWDVSGAIVRDAGDAATLLRALRSPYVETMKALFVDESGVVLHSSVLSIGSVAGVNMNVNMLSREMERHNVEGVAGVIIAHNHPSGDPGPSRADVQVTRLVREAMEQVGIPLVDHVITNGTEFYSFAESGLVDYDANQRTQPSDAAKAKSDEVYRSKGVPTGELAAWEIVPNASRPSFDTSEAAYRMRKKLGSGSFVLYVNRKNGLQGVDQLADNWTDEAQWPTISRQIFQGVGRNGASAILVVSDRVGPSRVDFQAVGRLRDTGRKIGYEVIDIVQQSKTEPDNYYSFNGARLLSRAASVDEAPHRVFEFEGVPASAPINRSKLVKENLGLATYVANKFTVKGQAQEDLIQEARVGLIEAARGSAPASLYDQPSVENLQQLAFLEDWAATRGQDLDELLSNEAGYDAAMKLWAKSHPEWEPMPRKLASRMAGTDDDAIKSMMDMLNESVPDSTELNKQAQAQPEGAQTLGRPDLANPAQSKEGRRMVNAADEARKEQFDAQSHEQWEASARAMIAKDKAGTIRRLLEVAQDPRYNGLTDAIDVKATQILVADIVERAVATGDDALMRQAQILTHAYRESRTETARALAAGRDPHQTPAQRHKEFLANIFFKPDRKTLKRIDKAPSAAEKSRDMQRLQRQLKEAEANKVSQREVIALRRELLALKQNPDKTEILTEASSARLKRIEAELAKMGVTLEDIFSGEARLSLIGAKIVTNYAGHLDAKRKRVVEMLNAGVSMDEVRKVSSLSQGDINDVITDFRREFIAKHKAKFQAGLKASDVTVDKLLSAPAEANAVTEADALVEMEKAMVALGFGMGVRNKSVQAAKRAKKAKRRGKQGAKQGKETTKPRGRSVEGLEYEWESDNPKDGSKHQQKPGQPELDDGLEPSNFDISDPAQVARIARIAETVDGAGFDMLYEYWINAILSGPQTHVANITGNALNMALDMTLQRGMEASINAVLSKVGLGDPNAPQFGEFKHMIRGIMPGIMEGYQAALAAWGSETSLFENRVLGGKKRGQT